MNCILLRQQHWHLYSTWLRKHSLSPRNSMVLWCRYMSADSCMVRHRLFVHYAVYGFGRKRWQKAARPNYVELEARTHHCWRIYSTYVDISGLWSLSTEWKDTHSRMYIDSECSVCLSQFHTTSADSTQKPLFAARADIADIRTLHQGYLLE